MTNKKLFLMLLLPFLLCGCTVQYDFIIDEDLSLSEKAQIKEKKAFFDSYIYETPKEMVERTIGSKEYIHELNYQYLVLSDGTTTFTNHYDRFSDYIENNEEIYNQFFEKLLVNEEGNVITIQNEGEFYPYTEGNPYFYMVEDIDINIKIPFKVIDSNADKIDRKNGIYTWSIDKQTKEKSFYLKFDQSKKATLLTDSFLNQITIWILIALVAILGMFGFWVYSRYQETNLAAK